MRHLLPLVATILVLLLAGCAFEAAPLPAQAPDAYPSHASKDDVDVGAESLAPKRSKELLGTDITGKFYAVLVVIQNNAGEPLLVKRDGFRVQGQGDGLGRPARLDFVVDQSKAETGPGGPVSDAIEERNVELARDWSRKIIPDETVMRSHEKRVGIIFVKKTDALRPPLSLRVRVDRIKSGDTVVVSVDL